MRLGPSAELATVVAEDGADGDAEGFVERPGAITEEIARGHAGTTD